MSTNNKQQADLRRLCQALSIKGVSVRILKLVDPPGEGIGCNIVTNFFSRQEFGITEGVQKCLIGELNSCITEYVSNFPCVDSADIYPNFFEMSAEYYISNISCYKDGDDLCCSFCVELKEKDSASEKGGDYHGLEVLIFIKPNGALEVDGVVSSWGS